MATDVQVDVDGFDHRTRILPDDPTDCTVLIDGRRLDSAEEVLAYYLDQGWITEAQAAEVLTER